MFREKNIFKEKDMEKEILEKLSELTLRSMKLMQMLEKVLALLQGG